MDRTNPIYGLNNLELRHGIAFAASCCERLVPNYLAFVTMEDWGDAQILVTSLDLIWSWLPGHGCSSDDLRERAKQCESIIPDTDDFDTIFSGIAGNAVSAVIYTLQTVMDGKVERLETVSTLSIESLLDYLLVVNDPETEPHVYTSEMDSYVSSSPLLRAEMEKQARDLAILQSVPELTEAFLREFRSRAGETGIKPFDRGLVCRKNQ